MAKGFNSRGLGGMGGGMNMNMIKQAQKKIGRASCRERV